MAASILGQAPTTTTVKAAVQKRVVPLRLVAKQPALSSSQKATIECLRGLLHQAERGEIDGITYAALDVDGGFSIGSCGEASQNPGRASQVINAMWYATMRRIFGHDDE